MTKGNKVKQRGHRIFKGAIMEGLQEEATPPYFLLIMFFFFKVMGLAI